jgi:hypothetical protein
MKTDIYFAIIALLIFLVPTIIFFWKTRSLKPPRPGMSPIHEYEEPFGFYAEQ